MAEILPFLGPILATIISGSFLLIGNRMGHKLDKKSEEDKAIGLLRMQEKHEDEQVSAMRDALLLALSLASVPPGQDPDVIEAKKIFIATQRTAEVQKKNIREQMRTVYENK